MSLLQFDTSHLFKYYLIVEATCMANFDVWTLLSFTFQETRIHSVNDFRKFSNVICFRSIQKKITIIKRMLKIRKEKCICINRLVERCAVFRINSSSRINRDFIQKQWKQLLCTNYLIYERNECIEFNCSQPVSEPVGQAQNWSATGVCSGELIEIMNIFRLFFSVWYSFLLYHSIWSGVGSCVDFCARVVFRGLLMHYRITMKVLPELFTAAAQCFCIHLRLMCVGMRMIANVDVCRRR